MHSNICVQKNIFNFFSQQGWLLALFCPIRWEDKISRWSFTIEYPFIRHITCGMPVSNGISQLHKSATTSQWASDPTFWRNLSSTQREAMTYAEDNDTFVAERRNRRSTRRWWDSNGVGSLPAAWWLPTHLGCQGQIKCARLSWLHMGADTYFIDLVGSTERYGYS